MIDPLSAAGLVANILQFIDFTHKLFRTSYEIYREGGTADHTHLEGIASKISSLAKTLENPADLPEDIKRHEADLRKIAGSCEAVARDLTVAIRKVYSNTDGNRKWKCFYDALRLTWKDKTEIKPIQQKLIDLRQMLNEITLQIIRYGA